MIMLRLIIKIIFALTSVSICIYLILTILTNQPIVNTAPPQKTKHIFQTDKIESHTYHQGALSNKISADQVFVRSKRMGLFRVRNINEMVIKNLAIEQIVQTDQKEKPDDLFAALQQCLPGLTSSNSSPSTLGRIAAITIEGFFLKSSTSDRRILLECKAREGKLNNKSAQLELSHIVLRAPDSDRVISAATGQWNQTRQRFEIEGEYLAQSPRGTTKSHGISVDLHYHLEKL